MIVERPLRDARGFYDGIHRERFEWAARREASRRLRRFVPVSWHASPVRSPPCALSRSWPFAILIAPLRIFHIDYLVDLDDKVNTRGRHEPAPYHYEQLAGGLPCACHQRRSYVLASPAFVSPAVPKRKQPHQQPAAGAGRRRHAAQARLRGAGRRPHPVALCQPGRLRGRRPPHLARGRRRRRREEGPEARRAQRHRLPEQGDRRRGRPRRGQGCARPGGAAGGTLPHPARQGLTHASDLRECAQGAAERRGAGPVGRSQSSHRREPARATPSSARPTTASSRRRRRPGAGRCRRPDGGRDLPQRRSARRSSPSPSEHVAHARLGHAGQGVAAGPRRHRGHRLHPRDLARGRQHHRHLRGEGGAAFAAAGDAPRRRRRRPRRNRRPGGDQRPLERPAAIGRWAAGLGRRQGRQGASPGGRAPRIQCGLRRRQPRPVGRGEGRDRRRQFAGRRSAGEAETEGKSGATLAKPP